MRPSIVPWPVTTASPQGRLLLHVEVVGAVADEGVELLEGAGVEQLLDPLPSGHLALRVLLLDRLLGGGVDRRLAQLAQVGELLLVGYRVPSRASVQASRFAPCAKRQISAHRGSLRTSEHGSLICCSEFGADGVNFERPVVGSGPPISAAAAVQAIRFASAVEDGARRVISDIGRSPTDYSRPARRSRPCRPGNRRSLPSGSSDPLKALVFGHVGDVLDQLGEQAGGELRAGDRFRCRILPVVTDSAPSLSVVTALLASLPSVTAPFLIFAVGDDAAAELDGADRAGGELSPSRPPCADLRADHGAVAELRRRSLRRSSVSGWSQRPWRCSWS